MHPDATGQTREAKINCKFQNKKFLPKNMGPIKKYTASLGASNPKTKVNASMVLVGMD